MKLIRDLCEPPETIEVLKGETLSAVDLVRDDEEKDDEIVFTTTQGEKYRLYHSQDCCESVTIEDIAGDLQSLVGSPILVAESVERDGNDDDRDWESITWTYYKIDTIRGGVTIRWYGVSNGYYSESVDFEKVA